MAKRFNVNGTCDPTRHYMVNLDSRLKSIREMVDLGEYFTINRARQYGKTTTLYALAKYLGNSYEVVSLDFQSIASSSYENEKTFAAAFVEELLYVVQEFPEGIRETLQTFVEEKAPPNPMQSLFKVLNSWCRASDRPIVLMIDEVDNAANNQIFLDLLSQFRSSYLRRNAIPTFQSVILAGVYDVRNIKRKIRPEGEHKENSPWNIAADFDVEMSFSAMDIANMLTEYEKDYHTGMDIRAISELIYDHTSGYPVLVSRICQLLDEKVSRTDEFPNKCSAWTKEGFYEAEKRIIKEGNAYNERGENQLVGYLDYFHMKKGYMLSFNFNKNKKPGIQDIVLGDKLLVEAVV